MNPATTAPPARRLRADAVRNQQRILEAARRLFAERGLDVTLDDVAEAAGVGVGTVYRRFANKQELIVEVFDHNVAEMAEAVEAANRNPDAWAGVMAIFEYGCQNMANNRGFGEVMLEVPDAMERFDSVRDRIKPQLEQLIARAHVEGALREGITATDFFAMMSMVESIAAFARPVNSEVWRRYMAIVLDGARADCLPRVPFTTPPMDDAEIDRAKSACFVTRRK
ncbi:TetR/AcrR family transcriptional regulator [Nocardia alni]|uniref:TetR/AcrR family transcriptional regulator n=1 Tax=Nocardia alni TaxID=2815723 RepID=UPI001C21C2AF|nr:TetR/AcrR family transcriptional regulator [Nocardia alni]